MKKDPKDKEIAKLQMELAKTNEKNQKLKQENSKLRADNRKKRYAFQACRSKGIFPVNPIVLGVLNKGKG